MLATGIGIAVILALLSLSLYLLTITWIEVMYVVDITRGEAERWDAEAKKIDEMSKKFAGKPKRNTEKYAEKGGA